MAKGRSTRIGCCGFALSQRAYFQRFDVVEVQKSFYQPPQVATVEQWREVAPDAFEFAMKAWQRITHEASSPTYRRMTEPIRPERADCYGRFQSTREVFEAWDRTLMLAEAMRAKIIVFQCPARFSATTDNVRNLRVFFERIERRGHLLAWEPRGEWSESLIAKLCDELGLVHAVDPFKRPPVYGSLRYFRLHGRRGYASSYSDEDLQQLRVWCREAPSYALFNNRWMKEDALRFQVYSSAKE